MAKKRMRFEESLLPLRLPVRPRIETLSEQEVEAYLDEAERVVRENRERFAKALPLVRKCARRKGFWKALGGAGEHDDFCCPTNAWYAGGAGSGYITLLAPPIRVKP